MSKVPLNLSCHLMSLFDRVHCVIWYNCRETKTQHTDGTSVKNGAITQITKSAVFISVNATFYISLLTLWQQKNAFWRKFIKKKYTLWKKVCIFKINIYENRIFAVKVSVVSSWCVHIYSVKASIFKAWTLRTLKNAFSRKFTEKIYAL